MFLQPGHILSVLSVSTLGPSLDTYNATLTINGTSLITTTSTTLTTKYLTFTTTIPTNKHAAFRTWTPSPPPSIQPRDLFSPTPAPVDTPASSLGIPVPTENSKLHNIHPRAPELPSGCPPLELIFARGTNEPAGLGKIGEALSTELKKYYPEMTAYGVSYTARTYMGKWLSKGRLEEGAGDIERRVAMWEELRDRGVCDGTRVVLGGFSLGAAVLQKTKLTPEQQELVDAVVIFGYPWVLRPSDKRTQQYPVDDTEKVWTKCIPQDPICNRQSIFSDGSFKAHKDYAGYVEEAGAFIRGSLSLPDIREEV